MSAGEKETRLEAILTDTTTLCGQIEAAAQEVKELVANDDVLADGKLFVLEQVSRRPPPLVQACDRCLIDVPRIESHLMSLFIAMAAFSFLMSTCLRHSFGQNAVHGSRLIYKIVVFEAAL